MKFSDFFVDLIKRLFAKTPKFFVFIRYAGLVLAAVMKIPIWMNEIGIQVPITIEPYRTILMVSGLVSAFISQLTIADNSRIKPTLNMKM